jgi:hypothetical protein
MRREGADIQSDVPTRSRSRARRDTATSTFRTNQDTDGSALSRDRRLVSPRPRMPRAIERVLPTRSPAVSLMIGETPCSRFAPPGHHCA